MNEIKYSESEIIEILKNLELRKGKKQLYIEHRINIETMNSWVEIYEYVNMLKSREVRLLIEENARLKKIVGDVSISIKKVLEMNTIT